MQLKRQSVEAWQNGKHHYVCADRSNKIVVLLKLLPSRAFPMDGRSAGPHARKNGSGD